VTGPRTPKPRPQDAAVRAAAEAAVKALLDVPLPPLPRHAVIALQAALEANP
jgi:hypothetical protein